MEGRQRDNSQTEDGQLIGVMHRPAQERQRLHSALELPVRTRHGRTSISAFRTTREHGSDALGLLAFGTL